VDHKTIDLSGIVAQLTALINSIEKDLNEEIEKRTRLEKSLQDEQSKRVKIEEE
jgi:Txe/YoeB family toxin of Txe-Axe toxin-antitoxin module